MEKLLTGDAILLASNILCGVTFLSLIYLLIEENKKQVKRKK